jgi:hypothetical protein
MRKGNSAKMPRKKQSIALSSMEFKQVRPWNPLDSIVSNPVMYVVE